MNKIAALIGDMAFLVFPSYCYACSTGLYRHEANLCLRCRSQLPKTGFTGLKGNPIEKLFWGRAKIETATSLLQFTKRGVTQKLLYSIKYKGARDLAEDLGEMLGKEISKSELSNTLDMIVPVPLHPRKLQSRGYNQSLCISKGIAKKTDIQINTECLIRTEHTASQTHKSRIDRWENVHKKFRITYRRDFENKHILIVDDVVTTGSTLEACASTLLSIKGVRVSIATLAFPMN